MLLLFYTILFLVSSCSSGGKLASVQEEKVAVGLEMTPGRGYSPYDVPIDSPAGDTLIVKDAEGRDIFILKAVRDESTGEMVANDVIQAACVTARFRNVADRDGQVRLDFRITVPEKLLDSRWQIRFVPQVRIAGVGTDLEPVKITGRGYRRDQLKGYQRYYRFLSTIVTDTTKFIDIVQLERFVQRNIPELYALRSDSSLISDERFASIYGVTAREAVSHYTNKHSLKMNERRKARREAMYRRYVRVPIDSCGIRLDTVITEVTGDFIYDYHHTLKTMAGLRKLSVVIRGGLYEGEDKKYDIPAADSITFYISSLGTLADSRDRFLRKIISRRVTARQSYAIAFALGKSELDTLLSHNGEELETLRANVLRVLGDEVFALDSITVTASSSPEGKWNFNQRLSIRRGESLSRHLRCDLTVLPDSVRIINRSMAEDWDTLSELVSGDGKMTAEHKNLFLRRMEISDPDRRENALRSDPYYGRLKDSLFPQLRRVILEFSMHRRGMVTDTVFTHELDTTYMRGITALRNGQWLEALACFQGYDDINSALAYCGLGRNHSALAILENCEASPRRDYLLALVNSRLGNEQEAVRRWLLACRDDPSFIHRGNLDPEISSLIYKYNLTF